MPRSRGSESTAAEVSLRVIPSCKGCGRSPLDNICDRNGAVRMVFAEVMVQMADLPDGSPGDYLCAACWIKRLKDEGCGVMDAKIAEIRG